MGTTRRGMTIIEVLVVVVLFGLAVTHTTQLYFSSVSAEKKIGVKLDLLHHAQIASLRLTKELRHAVEIFHPPVGINQTRPFVIFSNEINHLMVLFVNEKKELVLMDRTEGDKIEILGPGVTRVRFFRKQRRLLNWHIILQDQATQERFDLMSGVCIRNNFN